jgi:hypothetical protein
MNGFKYVLASAKDVPVIGQTLVKPSQYGLAAMTSARLAASWSSIGLHDRIASEWVKIVCMALA